MDMEKSSRINRRGFLKTVAAAGAVGLGARGAAASQKRTLVYKPGVYTAKAAGISSDVNPCQFSDFHNLFPLNT